MKKIITLALLAMIMTGCEQTELNENLKHIGESMKNEPILRNGMIVTLDSCQYVVGKFNHGTVYTHHNNCRFCKERRKQELKFFVEQIKQK